MFFTVFPLFMLKSIYCSSCLSSLIRSFLKSDLSNSLVLYKKVTMRDLLRSLMTKEQWERYAFCTRDLFFFTRELLFFTSESLFRSQKTSDLLKKPMSKFQTLVYNKHARNYLYAVSKIKNSGHFKVSHKEL